MRGWSERAARTLTHTGGLHLSATHSAYESKEPRLLWREAGKFEKLGKRDNISREGKRHARSSPPLRRSGRSPKKRKPGQFQLTIIRTTSEDQATRGFRCLPLRQPSCSYTTAADPLRARAFFIFSARASRSRFFRPSPRPTSGNRYLISTCRPRRPPPSRPPCRL